MAKMLEDEDGNKSSTRVMSFMFALASIAFAFLVLYAEAKLDAKLDNSMVIFAGLLSGCGGLKLGNDAIKKLGGK